MTEYKPVICTCCNDIAILVKYAEYHAGQPVKASMVKHKDGSHAKPEDHLICDSCRNQIDIILKGDWIIASCRKA